MFIITFYRRDWSSVACFIELKAKTLAEAKKEMPKAMLDYMANDEGGGHEFEELDQFIDSVDDIKLLEIKKTHKIDPDTKPFNDEFESMLLAVDAGREVEKLQQEKLERQQYERLKEKFNK